MRKVRPGVYVGIKEVEGGATLDYETLPPVGPGSIQTHPRDHPLPRLLLEKSKGQYLPLDSH